MILRRRPWLPGGRLARRSRGPLLGGVWLRVLTRWSAAALDWELANGTDPSMSDELSLRVGQLASPRMRGRLARAVQRSVELASGRHAPLITTRLRRPEIRDADDLLLALAARLRDGGPLGIRGLALTSRLVNDRSSPLYRAGASGSLRASVMEALIELGRGQWTVGATGA